MKISAQYAYTQVRLQARHGERLDEIGWHQLEAQQGLANFLHIARETSIRPWVLALHSSDDLHTLEANLLRQYREYVEQVSRWQPGSWRAATRWTGVLPDLPVIQHLLSGENLPSWLAEDLCFKSLLSTNPDSRLQAMNQTPYQPLAAAWNQGAPITEIWMRHWKSLWPRESAPTLSAVEKVSAVLLQHRDLFRDISVSKTQQSREDLTCRLNALFRRYTQQPAAVFAHLGLIAIDVERLRGNIARRALFSASGEGDI